MAAAPRIGLLDPSIGTGNTGDLIIRESVSQVLVNLQLTDDSVVRLPTQRPLTSEERDRASRCEKFLLGGTNLLSSNMPWYMQWKLRPRDLATFDRKVMLLGVGWWQYQRLPNIATGWILRRVLSSEGHSIRDSYSLGHLNALGVSGVNTGCPTMWQLPAEPESRTTTGSAVVVALTDYNRSADLDRRLLARVDEQYPKVALWPQGSKDSRYLARIAPGADILPPTLESFDAVLRDGYDYVGTRLHAGIRALQFGCRSTVVAIDNRATEIGRDTALPVVPRTLEGNAEQVLFGPRRLRLSLPRDSIDGWVRSTREWLWSG